MLVIRILAHLENLKRNRKSLKDTQDTSQPQINYSSMLGAIAFGLLQASRMRISKTDQIKPL